MLENNKIETFIGFAIKARALTCGTDSVGKLKKAYVVLVCSSASENTLKEAVSFSNKFGCPLLRCKNKLEDFTRKANCKIAAVTDVNLAKAVVDNENEDFSFYPGGNGQ